MRAGLSQPAARRLQLQQTVLPLTDHWALTSGHRVPSLQLPRALKDQLQRAAASIVLNLAEGFGAKFVAHPYDRPVLRDLFWKPS
jgi:four helix bundle protein